MFAVTLGGLLCNILATRTFLTRAFVLSPACASAPSPACFSKFSHSTSLPIMYIGTIATPTSLPIGTIATPTSLPIGTIATPFARCKLLCQLRKITPIPPTPSAAAAAT